MNKELISELEGLYLERRGVIGDRLEEFRKLGRDSGKRIFAELCFCLCTPQSKAKSVWFNAILPMMQSTLLYSGSKSEITKILKSAGVRFHNNKASYIVNARNSVGIEGIKKVIQRYDNIYKLRKFLVGGVKGLGMKEASHFLRNIGLGRDIAILDRHILRSLERLGIIEEVPKSISNRRYIEIERRMLQFSKEIGIPLEEMDMLMWCKETGEVFK
ncbi:MAG TPA: N-glycosylase/DNA lyase [Candidatus Altiarchaeales archaeon]|nr:N-glycosylase/DNA lyase [Candidatus Altiarchaeales archaeon]